MLVAVLVPGIATAQGPAPVGQFDYYVLALSWSPQHCATDGRYDSQQCGVTRHYGFVVHGLWPQFQRGGYPQSCAGDRSLPSSLVQAQLDMMPNSGLVRHEWSAHGTCSGLSARDYFATVRQAWQNLAIPAPYRRPDGSLTRTPTQIRSDFLHANPALPAQSVAVVCSGRFLQEVRVCYDRELKPRPCGADVLREACRTDRVMVRPVR